MKTFSLITKISCLICIVFIVGCDNMTVSTGDGSEKVQGDGKLGSEVRDVTTFNQIKIQGVFNIFLSQKSKESLRVEADENILPLVISSVENNVLTIKLKDNTSISKAKKINIYISLVDLAMLKTEGVGMLTCENKLLLQSVDLNLAGVGVSRFNIEANQLNVKSEMIGALFFTGAAKNVTIKHKGVGALEAFDLKAERLDLQVDGIGKAEVFASTELIIDSKGIGGVKYKGNPETKNIKNEGLGNIESVN